MNKSRLISSWMLSGGFVLLGLLAGFSSPLAAQEYKKIVKCPGGQGYCEDASGKSASGISIQEDRGPNGNLKLTAVSNGWSNQNATLAWYFYTTAGEYDIDLITKVNLGATLKFEFSIEDINDLGLDATPAQLELVGTGASDTTQVLRFKAAKTGFYKFKLTPKSNPNRAIEVRGLQFKSLDNASADVHPTNYLSSPSVHLSSWRSTGLVTSGTKFDWCYQEILVPEGEDPVATYYMSLGVLSGYFGIQTNSPTARGVIFSMWDEGSTDDDPNLPEYLKAGYVDYGENTTVSRFGNEGTGMKSFVHGWNWDTGVPVKFLVNSRLEQFNDTLKNVSGGDSIVLRKNTLVTAWFHANEEKGWQYVSTLRMPNKVKYFDSWYSFLENFGYGNGQLSRKAYYYNGFAKEQSNDPAKPGKWRHFNRVNFGNTDGAVGQRVDFEQGASSEMEGAFYMRSGGYGKKVQTSNEVTLLQDKSVVENLDLAPFVARVDAAIAKEKAKSDSIKNIQKMVLPKKGWSIISSSSEETSGEPGVNGRATCTIDEDLTTYWHSKWQGGAASLPHHIAFNMDTIHYVTGIQFRLSGGESRRMKDIVIQSSVSDGRPDFRTIDTYECPNQDVFYIKFEEPVLSNAIKVIINTTQTGVSHCRINDFGVTANDRVLSTPSISEPKSGIAPNPAKEIIVITPSKAANQMNVEVIDLSGRSLQTKSYSSVEAGVAVTHNLSGLSEGVYTVRLSLDKQSEVHKLIIKK